MLWLRGVKTKLNLTTKHFIMFGQRSRFLWLLEYNTKYNAQLCSNFPSANMRASSKEPNNRVVRCQCLRDPRVLINMNSRAGAKEQRVQVA